MAAEVEQQEADRCRTLLTRGAGLWAQTKRQCPGEEADWGALMDLAYAESVLHGGVEGQGAGAPGGGAVVGWSEARRQQLQRHTQQQQALLGKRRQERVDDRLALMAAGKLDMGRAGAGQDRGTGRRREEAPGVASLVVQLRVASAAPPGVRSGEYGLPACCCL